MKTNLARQPAETENAPQNAGAGVSPLADHRPAALVQRQLCLSVNQSDRSVQHWAVQEYVDHSPRVVAQRQRFESLSSRRQAANAPVSASVVQRAGVGLGEGDDQDRAKINVGELTEGEKVCVAGDNKGRAKIISDFIVNKVNYIGKILKHYAVVKSGALYQFPIKHVFQPKGTLANQGDSFGARGGQPEGFGGNQDIKSGKAFNGELEGSRDFTLARNTRKKIWRITTRSLPSKAPKNSAASSVRAPCPLPAPLASCRKGEMPMLSKAMTIAAKRKWPAPSSSIAAT